MQKLIFKTLLRHIKQHNFLLASDSVGTNSRWSGTDTNDVFQTNLKRQPSNWHYSVNPVRYTVNSKGYRTKEFKKIKWEESVVLFGCSNTFGVGLDDKDTLAARLENIIGMPVINMGQGGTSMNYNLHNSVILANGYPTPRAVVQVWPSFYRCVYYQSHSIENYGHWNIEKNNYMDLWSKSDTNLKVNAIMTQTIFKQIWKDRTSIYECSFNGDSAELLECASYCDPNESKKGITAYQDFARDLMHPGIETVKQAAEDIANNICIN
jgi:hypothetical protein